MEKYVITLGDFLKNAGIVGFHYMLETAGAEKEVDFGYTDDNQAMWVSMDYAQNADWTDMYFKAFIRYFGPFSTYQGIKDKIQSCLEKIESENWNSGKQEKEDRRRRQHHSGDARRRCIDTADQRIRKPVRPARTGLEQNPLQPVKTALQPDGENVAALQRQPEQHGQQNHKYGCTGIFPRQEPVYPDTALCPAAVS